MAGLVAAAGASSRMGYPKALLPFWRRVASNLARTTFVGRIVEVMLASRLSPVIVTLPEDEAEAERIAATFDILPVTVCSNMHPHAGLTGSVMTALEQAPGVDGLVMTPVDCPFIDVGLVQGLVRALEVAHAAVPVVGSARGHPVAFGRATFELLCAAGPRGGPRAVLDALDADVMEVPWTDPRVCEDIDTAADYERVFGRRLTVRRQG